MEQAMTQAPARDAADLLTSELRLVLSLSPTGVRLLSSLLRQAYEYGALDTLAKVRGMLEGKANKK